MPYDPAKPMSMDNVPPGFDEKFLAALDEMIELGLITRDGDIITLTEKGVQSAKSRAK